ncbi:beta-1,4-galactosyltransferase 1-like [Leptidea sinapis]|uniref:beta-1,4-galactosyltransferase 1-like n=1 Tax=Leptidea sinapis TaxID=189913 RepID=UPI002146AD39|nr:beta-1,4-galactosyltransferase 1-like [Leptidea sinapis]
MRHVSKKKAVCFGLVAGSLILFLRPNNMPRQNYEYIKKESILESLKVAQGFNFSSTALANCDYYDVVNDDTSLMVGDLDGDLEEGHKIKEGGEYAPLECKPKYSTAIIVPYRDRAEHLRGFLVHMHTFLRRQHIHYRIYVVEQVDTHPFNRAKLLNVGAKAAMNAGYPCLILHDVDLLPLKLANIYACTSLPRHMSSNTYKLRFMLPYHNQLGGVIAILSEDYKAINGMSNKYYGTSGDNDDLFFRVEANNLKMCRFDPTVSMYHILSSDESVEIKPLKEERGIFKDLMWKDGLNTLEYTEVATVLHPLFTHIMIDT